MPMLAEKEAAVGADRAVSKSRPCTSEPKGLSIVARRLNCIAERATVAALTALQIARAASATVNGSNLAA